jgi:hypothetical protein
LTLSASESWLYNPSVGERLKAFRDFVEKSGSTDENACPTQLLAVLGDVKTMGDIQDWLSALTLAHCKIRPDLLSRFSKQVSSLLPHFSVDELRACVKCCLRVAAEADQSAAVWANLCAGLRHLSPPAMQALLDCLQSQEKVPSNGDALVDHVKGVVDFMSHSLQELGLASDRVTRW